MKIYLVILLASTLSLIACEQQSEVPHERAKLPAADISDAADQRTSSSIENPSEDVSDIIEDIEDRRDLRSDGAAAFDGTEDMRDEYDEAADRRTYERTEEMAEDISNKIEKRLDQLPDYKTPDAAADVREDAIDVEVKE